jgi:uncharacterized protein YceH (UPF0502 family)
VTDQEQPISTPRWRPCSKIDRRVLGVLIEKAKTTPDVYPMSINAIRTGANQKNNRDPIMRLEPDHVEDSLDRLRNLGAVAVIQGSGRVSKYRHYLYDWLGVDKVELAVMAELLLRGAQTEGELRGRAARMEPIADLSALRPVLDSLKSKGLVIPLSPEGRGHVVTHALYEPAELERLKAQYRSGATHPSEMPASVESKLPMPAPPRFEPDAARSPPAASRDSIASAGPPSRELAELRSHIAQLREDLDALTLECQRQSHELERLRESLGG